MRASQIDDQAVVGGADGEAGVAEARGHGVDLVIGTSGRVVEQHHRAGAGRLCHVDDVVGRRVAEKCERGQFFRRVLGIVDQQATRPVSLVEELLDVSRLEEGQLPLHIEPFDLAALLRDVVETTRLGAPEFTIRLDTPPGPVSERELVGAVRRHHEGPLSKAPVELVDRLADHFLRVHA